MGRGDRIVVVDNNSFPAESSKNRNIVSSIIHTRYVISGANSIPVGRNKGLEAIVSSVDIVAFIDDDCVAADNWVSSIKRQHELNNRVDVLQGSVNHLPRDNFYAQFTAEMYGNWLESNKTSNMMRTFDSKNVSFKARIFQEKKNRFNEHLTYSSDIELGQRLCRQGLCIRYEPSICVSHYERDSFFPFIKQHMNIAAGEKDVGVGLVPSRYRSNIKSVFRLAKQFIIRGDISSLIKLCIIVPILFVLRSVRFL